MRVFVILLFGTCDYPPGTFEIDPFYIGSFSQFKQLIGSMMRVWFMIF